MTLTVGSRVELDIERLSLGGDGVARANGLTVFVAYVAPGDRVEAEITELRPRYARAKPVRVLHTSPDRTEPPCPYHFHVPEQRKLYCGGCQWQHLRYEAQLEAKRQLVQETMERIGGLRGVSVRPVLGMKEPWRFRNKVQQPVGWDGHRLISGFFAPNSHDIVPIDDCLVQPELSVQIVNRTKELLNQFRAQTYDEKTGRGWIRHVLVRTSTEGQALLVFVTRTPDFAHERALLEPLIREFPALAGIHQNVNPAQTNVILGRQWRKLAGADFIEERLGPLRFRLSPGSFFQTNSRQAKVLYDVAARLAGQGPRLVDLYCGVGGLALALAGNFERVIGVEEFRGAVRDAEQNATLNGIGNVKFFVEPAERFLAHLRHEGPDRELVVVLDPPRAGCTPAVLQGLTALEPKRIVYVSCDPATLSRDLAVLAKAGYRVEEVQPVDLFPQTAHIETVVKLVYAGRV